MYVLEKTREELNHKGKEVTPTSEENLHMDVFPYLDLMILVNMILVMNHVMDQRS